MRSLRYLIIVSLASLVIVACEKIKTLPDTPHIGFKSFTVTDAVDSLGNTVKAGTLDFNFEDGDGDLGLNAPENSWSDSINLFVNLYRIENGKLVPAPADDPLKPTGFRIPYMPREGQNKILKGTIAVTFTYLFYSDEDSLRYSFYVRDRALNVSNTDSTGIIPISKNGVYTR